MLANAHLLLQFAPPAEARLTAGDPIKNASAILRYALPIDDNKPIRKLQVGRQLPKRAQYPSLIIGWGYRPVI